MQTQDAFISEFLRVRSEIIQPTLERIGLKLRQEGHDFKVTDDPATISYPLLSPPYASVTLYVFSKDVDWNTLEGLGPFKKVPFVSFGLSLAERKVTAFINPSSENRYGTRTIRSSDHYALEEVTAEVIEREVSQLLKEIPLEL